MAAPGAAEHRGGEIDPGYLGAASRRGASNHTGTATNVEHSAAGANLGRVEQGSGELCQCMREGGVVFGRHKLPTGMFECPHGLRIEVRHTSLNPGRMPG